MPPQRRAAAGIRRTFQNLRLFREMTALENVMVGLHANTQSEIFHSLIAYQETKAGRARDRRTSPRGARFRWLAGLR